MGRVRGAVAQWAQSGGEADGAASTDGAVPADGGAPPGGAAQPAQRKARGGESVSTVGDVQRRLGGGHALDLGARQRMQSAFGRSFDDVRIHTDDRARSLSMQLGARAFTVGKDVAFAEGEYRPGTLPGDALIAHELAHVAQQEAAPRVATKQSIVDDAALEHDADRAAIQALQRTGYGGATTELREAPQLQRASGLQLARCKSSPPSIEERFVHPASSTPKAAPGEEVLFSALFQSIRPSQFQLVYTGVGGHFDSSAGPTTKTFPGLALLHVPFFIDAAWNGTSPVTVQLQVRHTDSGTNVFTKNWTFQNKPYFATTITQFSSDPFGESDESSVAWNGVAEYTYLLGPANGPDGAARSYENHTVLERFGGQTCNLTPADLTPEFRAAHPDLTSPSAIARYFDGGGYFNASFIVNAANQITDLNSMGMDADKINELRRALVTPKEVTLDKTQTFETQPGVALGRYVIRKFFRTNGSFAIRKFRAP
ncbi:DUF4157 domain-containing protein [Sorangium sp. So ce269]